MPLEKFILELAVKRPNIGIKAYQYFQSFAEDTTFPEQDKAMDFYNDLESTLVNGEIPSKYQKKEHSKPQTRSLEEYQDKKFKADYLTL